MLSNLLYAGIALAQVGVLVWYVLSARKKKRERDAKKNELAMKYPFDGLRSLAFNNIPGYIVANAPADEFFIYTFLMDWNIGNDVITLAAQATGEANLYVKSGGGIVGAGKHISVSEGTQLLFFEASKVAADFNAYTDYSDLPPADHVAFYILTNRGNFKVLDSLSNMQNRNSKFYNLFGQANKVLSLMKESAVSSPIH